MAPNTKSASSKFLIGQPSSVLDRAWMDALSSGSLKTSPFLLPFAGKARLPTKEQTFLLYFAFREVKDLKMVSKAGVAELTAYEVVKYWVRAPIKTVSMPTVKTRIIKLLEEHDSLLRNKSRQSVTEVKKRENFKISMKYLFDIACPEAEKIIQQDRFLVKKDSMGNLITKDREDDLDFLADQRGARVGWMSGKDKVYEKRMGDKAIRNQKEAEEEKIRQLNAKEAQERPKVAPGDVVEDVSETDEDFNVKESKKRKTETVTVELPRNPWKNPETTAMMDRLKMTSSQAMGFFSSIVKTGTVNNNQADLNEFTCSPMTIVRSRNKNRGVLLELAMEELNENKPKHCNIHWDGKQLTSYLGEVMECEAVMVSGSPSYIEGKLLAVAKLTSSSGESQFEAVKEQVLLWDIKDQIRSMTYDTTGSNTGANKGCCARLEAWLGRPVMWYGCRHHIGELMAKAAWYTLFEQDLAPTVGIFTYIKSSWDQVDQGRPIKVLERELYNKEEALEFYRMVLQKRSVQGKFYIRDDYKELVETSMVLLGETPPQFSWKKPGAAHKARFCAFGIYVNKALAFSGQLDFDRETIQALTRLATFIATLYVPYFISGSTGCDAPVNDLEMFRKLKIFSQTDAEVAESVLAVLCRHTWYLQEETVPFALFSKLLSIDSKSRLAAKLLTFETSKPVHWSEEVEVGQETYQLGKPILELNLSPKTCLVDLLGNNSFLLWDILGLDWEWLKQSPDEWDKSASYKDMKEYVCTVKVTNDCAERGVKLISDYISILTTDEEMRDKLLQGVEHCRRMFPNFNKSTLNK